MYRYSTFERHANFILSDINLLLKIVGIQTYIDLTLDNEEVANDRLEAVKYIFELYSSRNIGETGNIISNTLERLPFINNVIPDVKKVEFPSLLEIIHDNYRYTSENKDSWLNINDEMRDGNDK